MDNRKNLIEQLSSEGCIAAGLKVSNSIIADMEVYGFIPQDDKDMSTAIYGSPNSLLLLNYNMNNTVIASNRLALVAEDCVLDKNNTYCKKIKRFVYPIFKMVQVQDCDKNYNLPLKMVYIPKYMNNEFYLDFKKRNKEHYKLLTLDGIQRSEEQGIYIYTPSQEEFLFMDSPYFEDRAVGVGNNFTVICRRINSVTGNIAYDLFSPEDLFVKPE